MLTAGLSGSCISNHKAVSDRGARALRPLLDPHERIGITWRPVQPPSIRRNSDERGSTWPSVAARSATVSTARPTTASGPTPRPRALFSGPTPNDGGPSDFQAQAFA